MRRIIVAIASACALVVLVESNAHAGFEISTTVGASYRWNLAGGVIPRDRTGVGIEVMASYGVLSLLILDAGVVYDLTREEIVIRPGVRLQLGFLYIRLAVPLALVTGNTSGAPGGSAESSTFDLGLLFGIGARVKLGKFSLRAEVDITPFLLEIDLNKGVVMPAELRIGVAYHF